MSRNSRAMRDQTEQLAGIEYRLGRLAQSVFLAKEEKSPRTPLKILAVSASSMVISVIVLTNLDNLVSSNSDNRKRTGALVGVIIWLALSAIGALMAGRASWRNRNLVAKDRFVQALKQLEIDINGVISNLQPTLGADHHVEQLNLSFQEIPPEKIQSQSGSDISEVYKQCQQILQQRRRLFTHYEGVARQLIQVVNDLQAINKIVKRPEDADQKLLQVGRLVTSVSETITQVNQLIAQPPVDVSTETQAGHQHIIDIILPLN